MSNVQIAYNNVADSGTFTTDSGAATNYPVANLADANIDKPWRSGTSTAQKQFRLSLSASATAVALALVKHNLTSSALVRFRAGTAPFDVDFALGLQTDSRITFSGGANGTVVNSTGKIAASTCPRIDYDPATLACKGLLLEEARTNLLLWCRDLTNAAWTRASMSAAKTATGADGVANSATTLTATGANATCVQTVVSASAARASTAWVKRRTGTGTVQMTQDGGGTWTTITLTASYTRVSIPSATVTNPSFGFKIVTSGDAIDVDYCQLETGTFPTSAIPTTTTSVTRSADSATVTGSNFSSWAIAGGGTLYAEVDVTSDSASALTAAVATISDGTSSNEAILTVSTSTDQVSAQVISGGASQASLTAPGTITYGTAVKAALAYAPNSFYFCANGGAVQSDVSGSVPVSPTRLDIGAGPSSSVSLNGHIKRLTYWYTALSSTQLQSLTTSGPSAIDYDSGFVNALQMSYYGTLPSDWGSVYDVVHYLGGLRTVQYVTVEISDPSNASNYAQIGRFFMGASTFQPANNPEVGLGSGWIDTSTIVLTPTRKKLFTEYPKVRQETFGFPQLSEAEGDQVHDMLGWVGTTREVLYLPDPADAAKCQRYGFVGQIEKLDPLIYSEYLNRRAAFQITKKQ